MKRIILILFLMPLSVHAQGYIGGSYRMLLNGSNTDGGSITFGKCFGEGNNAFFEAAYFNDISNGKREGNGEQLSMSLSYLYGDLWFMIGPVLGIVLESPPTINYGVALKLAPAGLPKSILLMVDYGSQTGLGLGIAVPFGS
jgi:hypothetical protein